MGGLCLASEAPSALQTVSTVVSTLAIIGAGAFAWLRFVRGRIFKTRLALELGYEVVPLEGQRFLVFFDAVLKNVGQSRLTARPTVKHSETIWGEQFDYSCGLQLKRVALSAPANTSLDWFSGSKRLADVGFGASTPAVGEASAVPGRPLQIKLMADYEVRGDTETDFWMEPGEVYHLGAAVVLESGLYLARLTFIGDGSREDSRWKRLVGVRPEDEFWSRIFLVKVLSACVVSTEGASDVPQARSANGEPPEAD